MPEPNIAKCGSYKIEEEPGVKFWCGCGYSKNQPYCDGSHKGTGMGPTRIEITEKRVVAWCGCKHSGNMPFCDGAHKSLVVPPVAPPPASPEIL